uniref:CS domain-containing protein n=1 Tax=Anas platyrhynchos platyrhynchos TaxID=8840 RepID=A0A493TB95_ANAPP
SPPKQDAGFKAVSCRQDWHQTSSQVVVTIYAKNPLPALSSVKANRTVLEVHVIFEGNKIFQAELDLWGVIETEKSFVSMVPTKVEITLCKASPGPWARLEHPQKEEKSKANQKSVGVSFLRKKSRFSQYTFYPSDTTVAVFQLLLKIAFILPRNAR